MSFDTVNSSYAGMRNINNTQKRELLWNILEPGDPYDIKRSMIAKLPGDRKMFMGDNLEIVVLFQAAEIERLIENLDEYKLKYVRSYLGTRKSKGGNSIGTHTKYKLRNSHSSSQRLIASAMKMLVSRTLSSARTTKSIRSRRLSTA